MPTKPALKFPKAFLWGVSSSAHQVEGGTHNQWSVWELENARALASQASYHYEDLESWPRIKQAAKNPKNYVSGHATNHFTLYEQDFKLARQMHMNAWRFSIEWSRIQPEEGAWNADAIEHYRHYLAILRRYGLEPVVTLFHFTLPVWFASKGGFEKRGNVKYFVEFATRVLDEIGGDVRYIITINEPKDYAINSYQSAHWPPMQQSKPKTLLVTNNLVLAHNRIADIAHKRSRRYKVSVAINSSFVYPGDDAQLSRRSAAAKQFAHEDYILQRVYKKCDFLGVNYYFSDRVYGYRVHNPQDMVNDMGWSMQPENLQFALERLSEKYKLPIMITENGLADELDEDRQWWITQSILAMQKAMAHDVTLIGYLHWSLTDNFEWDKGYWPRFGLFAVNYRTYERTPRPSALWFGKVIKKLRGV